MTKTFSALCAAAFALACFSTGAIAAEHRCGWYENPSPGNLTLQDKDANWGITSQGEADGPDAVGADNAPDLDEHQFVSTGSSYGYGCACLTVETDAKTQHITKLISGHTVPLAKCRADKTLPKPD